MTTSTGASILYSSVKQSHPISPWLSSSIRASSRRSTSGVNFLWRIKRVEFALNSTWRRCMTGARGVLGNVEDHAACSLPVCSDFVLHVAEHPSCTGHASSPGAVQLLEAIRRPDCTLDDLIEAHTKYLNSITHKGLLGTQRARFQSAPTLSSTLPSTPRAPVMHRRQVLFSANSTYSVRSHRVQLGTTARGNPETGLHAGRPYRGPHQKLEDLVELTEEAFFGLFDGG
jgi:hypothetical protein